MGSVYCPFIPNPDRSLAHFFGFRVYSKPTGSDTNHPASNLEISTAGIKSHHSQVLNYKNLKRVKEKEKALNFEFERLRLFRIWDFVIFRVFFWGGF